MTWVCRECGAERPNLLAVLRTQWCDPCCDAHPTQDIFNHPVYVRKESLAGELYGYD